MPHLCATKIESYFSNYVSFFTLQQDEARRLSTLHTFVGEHVTGWSFRQVDFTYILYLNLLPALEMKPYSAENDNLRASLLCKLKKIQFSRLISQGNLQTKIYNTSLSRAHKKMILVRISAESESSSSVPISSFNDSYIRRYWRFLIPEILKNL